MASILQAGSARRVCAGADRELSRDLATNGEPADWVRSAECNSDEGGWSMTFP